MGEHNFSEYFDYYISKIGEEPIAEALQKGKQKVQEVVANLGVDQWEYAYAQGKWSIGQLFYHMLDTERIMCYRALSFARGQHAELPGYDHDRFAEGIDIQRSTKDLFIQEYECIRTGTILMFQGFTDQQLERVAHFNGLHIGVGQMARLIAGHEQHHLEILRSSYL